MTVFKKIELDFWVGVGKAFGVFLISLLLGGVVSAYLLSPVIEVVMSRTGAIFTYELQLRLYLAGLVFLFLVGYNLWAIWTNRLPRLVSVMVNIALLLILGVLLSDQGTALKDEQSLIRYPTALFLLAAAVTLLFVYRLAGRGGQWFTRRALVWPVLSAGLFFAAADELVQIHERLGTFLETTFKLDHVTTDLITAAYAVIGLVVMWLVLPVLKETAQKSRLFGQIYVFGFLTFGLATFFDTFDNKILIALRQLARLTFIKFGALSSAWAMIYDPKIFANSLEEILECAAAALFFIGALALLSHPPVAEAELRRASRGWVRVGGTLAIITMVAMGIFYNRRIIFNQSPLVSGEPVAVVASVKDGLFHTDDLTYHSRWGLIIANESSPERRGRADGPAVFVFKDGQLKKLADPRRLPGDTDSVAADDTAIYASDGAQGKIFVYRDEGNGWQELYTRKDGLHTPESLEARGAALVVLDERKKSVTEINPKGKLTIEYPRHQLFASPEGIVYHPGLKSYLITDDQSGTIFSYQSGGELKVWAGQNIGLKNPEDLLVTSKGEVVITDNGRGEVMLLSQEGALKKSLRFRPLFRDLQGVALDEQGNLYLVSADAHDYASFMPSFVWKISNFYQ